MLFLQRRFIIRAKLNLPINYSSLCEKYAFFAFSKARSISRAIALPPLPPPGKSRSLLRDRCDCTLMHRPAILCTCVWKTHVGFHRRLLIRGVWFSFALQFNLPASCRIFTSLFSLSLFSSAILFSDISDWCLYCSAIRQNDQIIKLVQTLLWTFWINLEYLDYIYLIYWLMRWKSSTYT